MVGSVRRERRRKGEESGPRKMGTSFRPGGFSFTGYVYLLTYLLMAITGLGYLALTWSTVVLLGGFVTSLQRKDFWCLTVISMLQAARSVMQYSLVFLFLAHTLGQKHAC
ncbi:hypothetical protein SETIT_8G069300v2 [Setaria italica]|uniref:Uncharacterized protein n=1 Tax=Setaria italica TaxID=4555 RepID=A0A368S509_SETIT|nr:hypothetical protein SETIT_8G069300v2 [Setaria italica]